MPKVTEAHLETRRQQILDAAFVCFARQGFHQTTVQDICLEAELSPGAVYRYFSSKEEIIEACCAECEQSNEMVIEAVGEGEQTLTILDKLASGAFSEFDEPDADVKLKVIVQWWSEAVRSPQLRETLQRTSFDFWTGALGRIIGSAQEKGEIDGELDPEAVARVLLSTWQGFVLQKVLYPDSDVESYLQVIRSMYSGSFWRGGNGAGPVESTKSVKL